MPATTTYAIGTGLFAVPVLAVTMFFGSGAADPPPISDAMICTVTADPAGAGDGGAVISLTGAQTNQARTIVAAAKALGLDQHAAAIGIMVAQQESTLANLANSGIPASLALPHEGVGHDHDSVGVFQQRPSMGWGTVAQLMSPGYAATKFFQTLTGVSGWATMPAWKAAQAVQRSADGTLYARWQALGAGVAAALFEGTTGSLTCTTPDGAGVNGPLPPPNTAAAAAAIAYARAQLGKPYLWGGTGPDRYDCSGLTSMAYRSAGITIPRTAAQQFRAGTAVPKAQLQPGDLVFFNPDANGATHVGLYLGAGLMIDARTGAFVRIEPINGFGTYMGARRYAASAT